MEGAVSVQNDKLKGFTRFGVNFKGQNQSQAYGDCPFCDKESKFYVQNITTLKLQIVKQSQRKRWCNHFVTSDVQYTTTCSRTVP